MRAYTVHAPPEQDEDPERFRFVKDGISWPALFIPVLWILWHRLWLALIGYVIFVLVVAWTGRLANEDAAAVVAILGGILFALEANNIRRLSLHQRGWQDLGASFGESREEAEIRFFQNWIARRQANTMQSARNLDRQGAIGRAYPGAGRYYEPMSGDDAVLGLFPEPER